MQFAIYVNTDVLLWHIYDAIRLQVPGVVVLVATAVLAAVLWPWAFCACSDTTWTDSDAMNKKGYQARPGFTLWILKIVQTKCIHLAHFLLKKKKAKQQKTELSVKCECAYLVCVCVGSFGRTEAWCGVAASSPAEGLFQVVLDLRMTEGPSCVSLCWTVGKLFCLLWWLAPQRPAFWQQFEGTWLDLFVENKRGGGGISVRWIPFYL